MGSFVVVCMPGAGRRASAVSAALASAPHRGRPTGSVSVGDATIGVSSGPDTDSDATVAADAELAGAYTGQLDNRSELATELGLPATSSPAEVVIAAHRRWGIYAPYHYRGPFAAAVTDGRSVFVARDPMGLRSAFYRNGPGEVVAASEVKQVLAAAGITPEPDLDVVEAIVFHEYDDETPTALKGGRRVPRGSTMEITPEVVRRHAYWDPFSLLETARYSPDELRDRFNEVMRQAAGRALLGDDVISLSGGTDSATVAAFAGPAHQERFDRPLAALSVVYPGLPEVDESHYIGLVADKVGLDLHTYEETWGTLDEVDDWMRVLDGPVPAFFLAESAEHYRYARSLGYRTMLTGELAEWVIERRDYLLPHLLLQGRIAPLADHLSRQRRVHGVKLRGMARQLAPAFMTPKIEQAWTTFRPAKVRIPPWIDEGRLRGVERRFATPARERWRRYQVAIFTGPDVAVEAEDIVQAVTGIRVRRPFSDLDLIEFFLSLPAEQKFPDTHFKGLVRSLMRGKLPDELIDRPSKAQFNDAVLARVDIEALRGLLLRPKHHIPGVAYDAVTRRLESPEPLDIIDYEWLKNLAATHAFLNRW